MLDNRQIPLSLYVHTPWCVQKCPYCDFNSHALRGELPENAYIDLLCQELLQKRAWILERPIQSIFIGGGTPSLFSAKAYERFFDFLTTHVTLAPNAEITLEANPGTAEQQRFSDYRKLGMNRLSIGVQSLNPKHLKILGRIHDGAQAQKAIEMAFIAGFTNFNVDVMFGLPEQTTHEAQQDLAGVIALKPPHLSWYELTLEPNTAFYQAPPKLPDADALWHMQQTGMALLSAHGYERYEVSAYCQTGHESQHNLNYWLFGDYLGLGAGAHSKITHDAHTIIRHHNIKHPKHYALSLTKIAEQKTLTPPELPFEFMLNHLRLEKPVDLTLFEARTGLSKQVLDPIVAQAIALNFMQKSTNHLALTDLGKNFLNDVVALFLDLRD